MDCEKSLTCILLTKVLTRKHLLYRRITALSLLALGLEFISSTTKDAINNGVLYSQSQASAPNQKSNSKSSTSHQITPLLPSPHSDTIFSGLQRTTRSPPTSGNVQGSPSRRKEWAHAKCLPFVIHSSIHSAIFNDRLFHSLVLIYFQDSRGLTSIQHSAALSTSLVLGGSPIPYPLFLAPESSPPPPIPSTMTEFRIRCACLSSPPNAHIAYMMDVKNKVFKVDMRARSILQIADLNMERGALSVRDEAAAIGTSADGTIRLFWRQGGGLWIRAIGERFATGSGQKMNLRGVWEDAGGG